MKATILHFSFPWTKNEFTLRCGEMPSESLAALSLALIIISCIPEPFGERSKHRHWGHWRENALLKIGTGEWRGLAGGKGENEMRDPLFLTPPCHLWASSSILRACWYFVSFPDRREKAPVWGEQTRDRGKREKEAPPNEGGVKRISQPIERLDSSPAHLVEKTQTKILQQSVQTHLINLTT